MSSNRGSSNNLNFLKENYRPTDLPTAHCLPRHQRTVQTVLSLSHQCHHTMEPIQNPLCHHKMEQMRVTRNLPRHQRTVLTRVIRNLPHHQRTVQTVLSRSHKCHQRMVLMEPIRSPHYHRWIKLSQILARISRGKMPQVKRATVTRRNNLRVTELKKRAVNKLSLKRTRNQKESPQIRPNPRRKMVERKIAREP